MKFKIITSFILITTMFSLVFSQTISNCGVNVFQNANLTQDINTSSGDCLTITADNIILDCKGFNLNFIGSPSAENGIVISSRTNVSVKNCNIYNFSVGMIISSVSNSTFTNIILNENDDYSIDMDSSTNNNFNTLTSSNNDYGPIVRDGSNNNVFTNIISNNNGWTGFFFVDSINNTLNTATIKNNGNTGLRVDGGSSNNKIYNSRIENNSARNVYFVNFGSYPTNNTFYNNHLGLSTKITSANWTLTPNNFNFSGIGNYYTDFTVAPLCFGGSSVCDYFAQTEPLGTTSSGASSIFPFGVINIIITSLTLFLGIIFL